MKQKYRKRILASLLSDLDDRDYDVREYGLFQLALILDRGNREANAAPLPEFYAENLTRDLLRLRISPQEQAEVGARLARLIALHRQSRSTAIWTLAKLKANIGLPVLLGLVRSLGEKLDNDNAIQVCDGLRNWLELEGALLASLLDSDATNLLFRLLSQWRERKNVNLVERSTIVIDLLKANCDSSAGAADQ